MSPPLAGAACAAQDNVPRPSPAAKAATFSNLAFDTLCGLPACVRIDANAHFVISASIGSVSPNLTPSRTPAELIIVKLCEEPFTALCTAAVIEIG